MKCPLRHLPRWPSLTGTMTTEAIGLRQVAIAGHRWIPAQTLPFNELILFAYAADRSSKPTYMSVCLKF